MSSFFKKNGLSVVFVLLFIISLAGQIFTGLSEYNKDITEEGAVPVTLAEYLHSGHFIQSTFENWESEFLQMALFVILTIFLRQKGSSESKKCEGEEDVDREPSAARPGAPWPVKKGGIILKVYKHSLSIALFLLFVFSFAIHFYGSLKDENTMAMLKSKPLQTAGEYLGTSRFWFESFQNWQSEFLSIFVIVIFSIYLRQQGSPQSKPVDAANDETGE